MKKAFIQLHLAVLLAGFTGVLGKLITLNEGLLVWYRLFFTSLCIYILFGIRRSLQRISWSDKAAIAGVGIIAALHWVSFYGSIKYSSISIGVVCFSAIGFFTAVFEPLILRKRINVVELLLGLITIAGIYVIFHFDRQYKTGIIIGLISALLASLFPIFNKEFVKRINVETVLTWQMTGGLLFLTLAMPVYLHYFPSPTLLPSLSDLGWLLVLAVFCSVIAFQLSLNALKKLSAFTVNLTFNLEPIYGIILAFLIYHENKYLGWGFFKGLAIISIALLIHIFMIFRAQSANRK